MAKPKWVPAVYFTSPREARVDLVVLHWMATTLAGADATFTGGRRKASAHYGIEGRIVHQYVKEQDAAWHSGDRAVNHRSIGVEHSAGPGRPATEATITESIILCTDLCRRYGLDADAIRQHNDYAATQCPGTLPVARIRQGVRANLAGAAPSPDSKDWIAMATQQDLDRAVAGLLGVEVGRTGVTVGVMLDRTYRAVADPDALAAKVAARVAAAQPGADLNVVKQAVKDALREGVQ